MLTGSTVMVTKDCTVTEDQVVAAKSGRIVSANRTTSSPDFDLVIIYDDEDNDITIKLQRDKGKPRYVLLFDHFKPNNIFNPGNIIAAKLDVPAGETLDLYEAKQTYYAQFAEPLKFFNDFLLKKGHTDSALKIGEDVCQLDMVACASPHWNKYYLGGKEEDEERIIDNCVSLNGWAIKQLVQTRPAVLFLVGESSYTMFKKAFGYLIKRASPLPTAPEDNAFTLFRETTNSNNPALFHYATSIFGRPYSIKTRLIVTPHFSYDDNFYPQFRMSKDALHALGSSSKECVAFLMGDSRIKYNTDIKEKDFDSFTFSRDDAPAIPVIINQEYPDCWQILQTCYYDGHQMIANVL